VSAPADGAGADLAPGVAATGLIAAATPLLVLYSGGRDSTCLLDCAVRIAGPASVSALHVNYGLRATAIDDEAHCRTTCERLGVALEVVAAPAARETGNLQAWARALRYDAATTSAHRAGAAIAAGHTASDQVETILYRLASSPSRRALLGMRPREDADPARPPLVRPLLGFTREQTTAHCRTRGLAWREDETNATGHYARGRVRHGLLPALEAVHPAAAANVLALSARLSDEAAVLDTLVDGVLGGAHEIPVATLRAQPLALQRLIVQRLADHAAGGPAAGVARRAGEVAALPGHGTASLDLPGGVRATARRGTVAFSVTPPLGGADH
jgi:tRNA(Ile)-lysidine synthase